jgi:release factor glutamine methyltransferase
MFLHDVNYDHFNIAYGDTLINPQHWDDEPFEVIVSNPPYLTAEEMQHLQPEVAQEPAMALEAGDDGLVFYRALAQHYRQALRPGGALVLEIGWQQRQAVMELLAGNGWADIECRRDYGGNDRCIIAHRPK